MNFKRWCVVLGGVLSVGVFGLAWVVDRFGQRDGRRRASVIMVLGARVLDGGVPGAALKARTEHAVALYKAGLAPKLLFSGGVGDHPPSEAQAAKEHALWLGVPAEACLLEEQSHSTRENAKHTAQLLLPMGMRDILLVSDPYHLFRASRFFTRQGFTVAVSPALLTERNVQWPLRLYWTMREAFAILSTPALW